jgi:hypothetical protein
MKTLKEIGKKSFRSRFFILMMISIGFLSSCVVEARPRPYYHYHPYRRTVVIREYRH